MNKTYKVIFSKVRGALMVCNEITSSVQKKGVKLVLLSSGLLFTSFAIANQITVSSEEAKLILVGDGATQQTAQITGQFEKGVQTTGTGKVSFTTGETQDLPEATYDYFKTVNLTNVRLQTYPTAPDLGFAILTGIETLSLNGSNLQVISTQSSNKSLVSAASLSTQGGTNAIWVGSSHLGNGDFKLGGESVPVGTLTLNGEYDTLGVANDSSTMELNVAQANINSSKSATFTGRKGSEENNENKQNIHLNATELKIGTPSLALEHTHFSTGSVTFTGDNQTLKFTGESSIHGYQGVKAQNILKVEVTELADATIYGSSATSLDKLTITNKGNLTITAHGGAVNVDELNQTGSATSTFSGNITISEVVDGFSGKVKISDTVGGITTSSLTIKSAAANKIKSNLNMGQGNLSDETKTNKLVINDATGTPYEFDKIRAVDGTGNSFVTVEGIVKTTELSSNDYHILKSAQGFASTTENASLTIDYGAREVAVTGLGNKDKSSLDAKGINLKSGTLKLGNGSDDSTFGTENVPVDFEMSGSSKLNVLGDTVHFGAYKKSETSETKIDSGAGTFNVHGNATLAGKSFTNANTADGNAPGALFHSSLTVSNGEFKTASGGTTTVSGTFRQEGAGKTIVDSGGTLNLNGGAEIAANTFSNAGTTSSAQGKEMKVSGGTFQTASTGTTNVNGQLNQTAGKTEILSGGKLNVRGETTLSGGEMNLAGTADIKKVSLSGGQLVSSGTTTVAALNQTTDTAALQIKSGTLTAASAALRKAELNGGKLSVTTADLSAADIHFKNGAEVEIAGLETGTTSLGKITVDDDNATNGVTGKFVYNGTRDGKIDSLSLGGKDALEFSARNAKLALDAANLKSDAQSLLNWDVKETTVTGTGENFKGQMNLVDVEAKTSGSTLNMVSQAFDAMFGQGKGKLNLGAKGTTDPQVRNILNVTGGELNLTNSSDETGSLVSGEGLIIANSGITLGAKYSGKTELQTAGKLSVGDNDGHFTLGSDSQISAGQLAVTPAESVGRLTVNGTLNLTGGESDIGSADIAVAPTAPGKGLNLDGSTTKLTTTGKVTATGTDALKVAGAGMTVGDL